MTLKARLRTSSRNASQLAGLGVAHSATVARGGPRSMMYVPRGCPHSFTNPGPGPARMIFLGSPFGHEHYQEELAELVASTTGPLDAAIAQLRARHEIEQLTLQVILGRP